MLGPPFVWAGPMGKAHCLNKKEKKNKSQKGKLLVDLVAAKKCERKLGEEGFEKEEERG